MLNPIVENNLPAIKLLCEKYKVANLAAFGSVCTDRFNENSDVDFLISFHTNQIPIEDYADNYFDLMDAFEKVLGREVDLVGESTLKNPYFIKTILKTKTPVYAG